MYKINPAKYTGVTVLPSEIAEKHLILASASQLKVIIYAFSKSGDFFDAETVSKGTGISLEEVNDALSYWKDTGFVLYENEEIKFTETSSETQEKAAPEKKEEPKKRETIPLNNPSRLKYDEICTRIGESEEIRILLNEAQLKLGRTIGTGDQSSLILLHDYYGLPVEVILCICEYAGTKGKSTNMNYIYKIGVDWSQREIDTIDAADEELKSIQNVNAVWAEFSAAVSLKSSAPTTSQEKYISQWVNEWNFTIPMLVLAYEEMVTHTEKLSFSYMHKILSDWHKKGINTPEKAEEEKTKFIHEKEQKALERASGRKKQTEIKPDPNASYDIKRAEERARTSVPKVKKREKR
ncbi:MAG: DnaD domain protein [Clostridia bacterium]|nr:DnaD domain protein [Clostridia bacterium]